VSISRFSNLPQRWLAGGRVVFLATTRVARARGLARLPELAPVAGLHIPQCRSVHTFGMRFALDLVWLDDGGDVVRIDRDVGRRRVRACRRAASVVEVRAGEADAFVAAGL
jgi:uncharacterized membrane protein (UPF0127 family)